MKGEIRGRPLNRENSDSNQNSMLNALCTQFKFGTKKSIFQSVNIWMSRSEGGQRKRERVRKSVCACLRIMSIPNQEWQIAKTYHCRHHILWFCSSSTMHIQYSIYVQGRSQKKHFRLSMNDFQKLICISIRRCDEFFNTSQNPKWFRNKFLIQILKHSNIEMSKCVHHIESTVIIIMNTNTIFDTKCLPHLTIKSTSVK